MKKIENCFKKIINSSSLYIILGILFILLLYIIISFCLNIALLPTIDKIFIAMGSVLGKPYFYQNIGMSILKLFSTTLLCAFLGIGIGIIAGVNNKLYNFNKPLITIIKAFPTICLLLILIAITKVSELIVLAFVIFPIVYESQVNKSRELMNSFNNPLRVDGISVKYTIIKIIIPLSYKNMIMSLIQSIGLGFKALIMAEVVSGSSTKKGIGNLLNSAYQRSEYPEMFALAFIVLIIMLILDLSLNCLKRHFEKKEFNEIK